MEGGAAAQQRKDVTAEDRVRTHLLEGQGGALGAEEVGL
jgi:hypothetical protein